MQSVAVAHCWAAVSQCLKFISIYARSTSRVAPSCCASANDMTQQWQYEQPNNNNHSLQQVRWLFALLQHFPFAFRFIALNATSLYCHIATNVGAGVVVVVVMAIRIALAISICHCRLYRFVMAMGQMVIAHNEFAQQSTAGVLLNWLRVFHKLAEFFDFGCFIQIPIIRFCCSYCCGLPNLFAAISLWRFSKLPHLTVIWLVILAAFYCRSFKHSFISASALANPPSGHDYTAVEHFIIY